MLCGENSEASWPRRPPSSCKRYLPAVFPFVSLNSARAAFNHPISVVWKIKTFFVLCWRQWFMIWNLIIRLFSHSESTTEKITIIKKLRLGTLGYFLPFMIWNLIHSSKAILVTRTYYVKKITIITSLKPVKPQTVIKETTYIAMK